MKLIIVTISFAAALLSGCQSTSNSQSRWNDMQIDIALRHKYEKYACGYHPLEGYSKDIGWRTEHVAARKPVKEAPAQPVLTVDNKQAQQSSDAVRELSEKIAVLEGALKSNVAATNQNQTLIVSEINSLKSQISELEGSRPVALQAQPAHQGPTSGIHIPGN
jgi:hypothetical protein